MMNLDITGALIGGGKSTRFGSDKRLFQFQGKTFLDIGFQKLKNRCGDVVCVFRDEIPEKFKEYPQIFDEVRVQGPMAGILAALHYSKTPSVLCLSCDVPYISERFLDFVCSFKNQNKIILPRVQSLEPLIGLYPISFYAELKKFSQTGNFSLHHFIQSLPKESIYVIEPEEWREHHFLEEEFTNVNTKADDRYQRHFSIPGFSHETQKKLKQAKVLVVGVGGLGNPALMYLAAAGVGTLGIVDPDRVDVTNLQRQILYQESDVGRLKVEVARERLLAQNSSIEILTYPVKLTSQNALDIFKSKSYDVIVDGTDNFPTRYLMNDASILLHKPMVYGSVSRFEGQVSVFNYTHPDGRKGPTYRCLYPEIPPLGLIQNCQEAGVLGVVPGMIGTLQANEVIKIITGIGEVLSGKLWVMDLLTLETHLFSISRNESIHIHSLGEDEDLSFCQSSVSTIPEHAQLIDVREEEEHRRFNIGGLLIPLNQLEEDHHKISRDKPVIFYCHSGKRSQKAVELFQKKFGYHQVFSLKGGIQDYFN